MSTDPSRFSAEPPKPQKGWFARNWIWILIVVGLGGLLSCGLCCSGSFFAGVSVLKSTEPYKMALEGATKNAEVVTKLGEPITDGMLPQGNINIQNNQGDANFDFDITGPKGTAKVHTKAELQGGTWVTTELKVTFSDGTSVDLTPEEK